MPLKPTHRYYICFKLSLSLKIVFHKQNVVLAKAMSVTVSQYYIRVEKRSRSQNPSSESMSPSSPLKIKHSLYISKMRDDPTHDQSTGMGWGTHGGLRVRRAVMVGWTRVGCPFWYPSSLPRKISKIFFTQHPDMGQTK